MGSAMGSSPIIPTRTVHHSLPSSLSSFQGRHLQSHDLLPHQQAGGEGQTHPFPNQAKLAEEKITSNMDMLYIAYEEENDP